MAFVGLCSGGFSLQSLEDANKHMSSVVKRMFGITGWISDNTFGRILVKLRWQEMQLRLWWQVRAFRERHQVECDALPIGTLAIDGKTVASGKKKMSRFAQRQVHVIKDKAGKEVGKRTYYKLHLMRAVLTSCRQKLCVWQHPVRSKANEITGTKTMLKQLFKLDKGKHLFELVTFDAMMMGYPLTKMISNAGRYWLSVLKENQPELHQEAQRLFGSIIQSEPEYTSPMVRDHKFWKVFRLWRTDGLTGWPTSEHTWDHLTQVWCVEVIRYIRTDKARGKKANLVEHDRTVRYYATSLPWDRLTPAECLEVARSHWQVEDDCFNSLDVIWQEDKHRHFTTGEGTLNLSFLRMMAYNVVQMQRRKERKNQTWDGRAVWESWCRMFNLFVTALQQHYSQAVIVEERMLQT